MDRNNPYAASVSSDTAPRVLPPVGDSRRRMRFWRIEILKAEMRAKPLSEREVLPYLLWYVGFFTLATGLPSNSYNVFDALDTIFSLLIAIFGSIAIYYWNGGTSGQHFLQRYFAIGFVVSVRCVSAFLVCVVGSIIVQEMFGIFNDETTWYELLMTITFQVVLYWRIAHHVADLAASIPGQESTSGSLGPV